MPLSHRQQRCGRSARGAVFTQIWKRVSEPDQEPPDPKDLNRSGKEALAAAALQGLGLRSGPRLRRPGEAKGTAPSPTRAAA